MTGLYEGESLGCNLDIVFFEDAGGGLVRRVHRDSLGAQQQLLTHDELLQTIGGVAWLPDPERTAATIELLLETHFQDIEMLRHACTLELA